MGSPEGFPRHAANANCPNNLEFWFAIMIKARMKIELKMISGILGLAFLFPTFSFAEDKAREWESAEGRKILAELVAYDPESGNLRIRRSDGVEFNLNQDQLSEGDQDFLAEHVKFLEEMATLAGTVKDYPVPGDPASSFHVYYPTNYSVDKPAPMLILFSPSGRGRSILDNFRESGEACGWVVVGCDTLRNGMDGDEAIEIFSRMLPLIEKAVPFHNPDRLYLGGMSGGSWRAFTFAHEFDRPWKGVVSCGGWLGPEPQRNYPRNLAVAFVNGDGDSNANSYVDRDTRILRAHRATVKLFPFPGGHVIGPPDVLTEAMKWVEENTKDN